MLKVVDSLVEKLGKIRGQAGGLSGLSTRSLSPVPAGPFKPPALPTASGRFYEPFAQAQPAFSHLLSPALYPSSTGPNTNTKLINI